LRQKQHLTRKGIIMTTTEPKHKGDHIEVGNITNAQAIAIGAGAAVYQGLTVEEVTVLFTEWKRADQPVVWDGRIPYLGLSAFQESDAQFFFGRESLVDDLLQRVTEASFITIAGPSGSGKSSVARAGLFHALRQGRLPRSDNWRLATMLPGGNPLEQLALAIERLTHLPGSGNHIRQNGLTNPLALHEQIQTLLTDDLDQRFVLLVDQFEESFTQTKDEAERAAFIQLLTTSAQIEGGRLIIILSLRSHFISHCARYPDLRELMSQQFQLVGAMEAHDLAKAITLPALEVGAEIDPALVSRIMIDMKGEPGALPLMSFALRDLFEVEKTRKGEPMDLTLPEYLHRGGIESALERHANQVFAHFSDEQQEMAKTIFSRLIEVGQGRVDTRRTAVFSELVPAGKDAAEVTAVVDALARPGARLLTTGGGHEDESGMPTPITVTIAHEKLIDAWPWLRQLVDENREGLRLQRKLAEAASAWDSHNRDDSYLYRGARLMKIEASFADSDHQLSDLERAFLNASREAGLAIERAKVADRQRIRKASLFGMIGGAAGFSLSYLLIYSAQIEDQSLLAVLTLLRVLLGAVGGLLLISLVDISVSWYQGRRDWVPWLLGGSGGAIAFAVLLFFDALLKESGPGSEIFVIVASIEGAIWGFVAGIGRVWLLETKRPFWQTLPAIGVSTGIVLLTVEQMGQTFGGASWISLAIVGALVPLSILVAAQMARSRQTAPISTAG
jgi:cytidylate kinase